MKYSWCYEFSKVGTFSGSPGTRSVIDLMIVIDITKVKASAVHDICIADHKLIYFKHALQRKKTKPMVATVTDYRKLCVKAYKSDVEAALWWICSVFDNVDK